MYFVCVCIIIARELLFLEVSLPHKTQYNDLIQLCMIDTNLFIAHSYDTYRQ